MKKKSNMRVHPLLGLVLLSILIMGCPPPVEEDENSVTDIEGNIYKAVTIGTQVWMAENLKTTKYNDGETIPLVTDKTSWSKLTTPGYCWYNNDATSYKSTYGALFNWYVINTGKLCPKGWHVPSTEDWLTLVDFLGGLNKAGGKLKEIGTVHWQSPNKGATNEVGFAALPGGYRYYEGSFGGIEYTAYWWQTIKYETTTPPYQMLIFEEEVVLPASGPKVNGLSVRCLKD